MALTPVLDIPANRQRAKADAKLIAEINSAFSEINQQIEQYHQSKDRDKKFHALLSVDEKMHELLLRIQSLQLEPSLKYILQYVENVEQILGMEKANDFEILLSGGEPDAPASSSSSASRLRPLPRLDLHVQRFVFNKKSAEAFQTQVNHGVQDINDLIARYHNDNHEDAAEQIEQLYIITRKINDLLQFISKPHKSAIINKVNDFRNDLEERLFEMKAKQQDLEPVPPKTLAEFIDKMSKRDVKVFTDILLKHNNVPELKKRLQRFYSNDHVRKKAFDVFLETHHIELMHSGNSKNFTVNKLGTTETKVLKVEYIGSNGNAAEMHLRDREALAGVFTSHSAQKHIHYIHPQLGQEVTGNLVVTEFCPGSDVEKHGKDFKDDDGERLKSAADVFTQMSDILIKIEAAGCAFPDMKAINWLLDSDGKLRVSDGKSFVFTNASGNISSSTNCMISEYLCAPEQWGHYQGVRRDISADKMHAYLLAKNLYHYLVRGDDNFLYDRDRIKNDAAEFDFSSAIFKTTVGQEYQALIERTLKTRPEDRLSVSAFQASISAIHLAYKQAETPTASITTQASIQTSQDYKARMLETRQNREPDVDPVSDNTPRP